MKLGLFGNCQIEGITRSIQALAPEAEVFVVPAARLPKLSSKEKLALVEQLASCRAVLYQNTERKGVGPLAAEALRARVPVLEFPHIAFRGFHPDCVCLRHEGQELRGPMGPYHSAICTGAFREGLSPERARHLFNSYTYARLGYFSVFRQASKAFEKRARAVNFRLSQFLRGEPFMHTVNHPNATILHEVASQALERLGIPLIRAKVPPDDLAKLGVWPLYPEIAEKLRQPGTLVFRHRDETRSLVAFIADSYAALAAATRDYDSPAVEAARQFIREEVRG